MFAVSLNKFMFLFSNYPKISYKILQYLDPQECLELSLACKTLNSSVNTLVEENLPELKSLWMNISSGSSGSEDEEEVKKEIEAATKKKNKQKKNNNQEKQKNGKWQKTTIFDLNESQKTNLVNFKHFKPKNVEEYDTEIQQKFFKENQNLIFKNEQTNDLIVVHRSLVDKSLDFQIEVAHEGESKYSEFFNSDNNAQVTYDFSNPKALLERQKQLLENLKNKELEKEARMDVTPKLESLLKLKNITVILCHGGYFSIGIFDKMKPVFHKSDHKYVVRKKAGKRQITRDGNAGSNIQSMGSQIRRDQEKKHAENIKKILTEAYKLVKDSDIVFYHAPGYNRYLVLDVGSPLFPLKDKFRSLCLTPKRANYTEVERIYNHLVKFYIIPAKQQQ